jgi:hypothetical protein
VPGPEQPPTGEGLQHRGGPDKGPETSGMVGEDTVVAPLGRPAAGPAVAVRVLFADVNLWTLDGGSRREHTASQPVRRIRPDKDHEGSHAFHLRRSAPEPGQGNRSDGERSRVAFALHAPRAAARCPRSRRPA